MYWTLLRKDLIKVGKFLFVWEIDNDEIRVGCVQLLGKKALSYEFWFEDSTIC